MLAHENPTLKVSQCGINSQDLISLMKIFQSYLKLGCENFPDKKPLATELAVVPNCSKLSVFPDRVF